MGSLRTVGFSRRITFGAPPEQCGTGSDPGAQAGISNLRGGRGDPAGGAANHSQLIG